MAHHPAPEILPIVTESILANPFFHALRTEQAHLALGPGPALRYPADVIPFAAIEAPTTEALTALVPLLLPNEAIYVVSDFLPENPALVRLKVIPVLQMHLGPKPVPPAASQVEIHPLTAADAPAMVHLTNVAFPGFFRSRTHVLGRYFGIRHHGELVSMAGERLALPGLREVSAVCTHPAHTGKGYAALLIQHLLRLHAAEDLRSFLHVTSTNTHAIALYERLGFHRTSLVQVHQLSRA